MEAANISPFLLLNTYPKDHFTRNSVIYNLSSNTLISVSKRELAKGDISKIEEYISNFLASKEGFEIPPEQLNNLIRNVAALKGQQVDENTFEHDDKRARVNYSTYDALQTFMQKRGYRLIASTSGKMSLVSTRDLLTTAGSITLRLGEFETLSVSLNYLEKYFPTICAMANGNVQSTRTLTIPMEPSQEVIAKKVRLFITERNTDLICEELVLEALEFVNLLGIEQLKSVYTQQILKIFETRESELDDRTLCHILEAAYVIQSNEILNVATSTFNNRLKKLFNEFKVNKNGAEFNIKLLELRSHFKGTLYIEPPQDMSLLYFFKSIPMKEIYTFTVNNNYFPLVEYIIDENDRQLSSRVIAMYIVIENELHPVFKRDGFSLLPNIGKLIITCMQKLNNEQQEFLLNQIKSLQHLKELQWVGTSDVMIDDSVFVANILSACPQLTSFTSTIYIPEVEDLANLEHLDMFIPNAQTLTRIIKKCSKLKYLSVNRTHSLLHFMINAKILEEMIPEHLKTKPSLANPSPLKPDPKPAPNPLEK
jgi:hypothetical protein